jgi:thiamine pyrophosphate-dependent acetolactate synthase large subunit-like protein
VGSVTAPKEVTDKKVKVKQSKKSAKDATSLKVDDAVRSAASTAAAASQPVMLLGSKSTGGVDAASVGS